MNPDIMILNLLEVFQWNERQYLSINVYERETIIQVNGPVHFNYDMMKEIASMLDTRTIDFAYDQGWPGTEVTPGDPSKFSIVIGVGSSMCCGRDHNYDGNCDKHPEPIKTRQIRKPDRRASTRRQDDKTKKRLVGKPVK